ncbi:MAG: glucose-6-phosphate isomerase [Bacteroidota bacterium]
MFPKINPTQTSAWKKLEAHFEEMRSSTMQDMFAEEPSRANDMAISWQDFYVDFSKNRITNTTSELLLELAREVELEGAIKAQFEGMTINETEGRAVGHTELRNFEALRPEVARALQKIKTFSQRITDGTWKGATGKTIQAVVNIGIGGSDLGPDMVCDALMYYRNHLDVHFISNVDGDHTSEVLKKLDWERTLFIVVSKTFTTQETLTNATTVRNWFLQNAGEDAIAKHFVAVSTNEAAVDAFGIARENMFPMWDWVGGRFSLWSSVGLSIACTVGYDHFEALLRGAHEMDRHFRETPFGRNIPVTLALLSVWYNNFFGSETECVVPYSQYLKKLVPYLQQGVMESNGKRVDRNGDAIDYQTGTIVWGSTGTNAQHAFFQLLHQGTKLIPTDFIAYRTSLHGKEDHQNKLLANCIAQSEALLMGTYGENVENNFKEFEGNKPSNTILIEKLTPSTLGSLIAMYEHKLFVQGVIWNIFSFDQWGVELGKKLAKGTLDAIEGNSARSTGNRSSELLVKKVQKSQ